MKNIEKERFQSDCLTFCEMNRIHPLDKKYLDRCLRIPNDGIDVKYNCINLCNTYYPIVTTDVFDSSVEKAIGHYDTNNDVIVFVYIDASTYVTRDWDVLTALSKAGYVLGDFPVPLSYDETICDNKIRKKWDSLPRTTF